MILNNIIKKYTFKKAQQLIEFAFVAPILIMFLLLIMEFGYVITIRNVISEGAKESLMQVNSKFNNLTGNAAVKKAAMETELKTSMESFLSTHGIANSSNVTVTVFTDANGVTFANFTYMYKMILTFIPNLPTIPIQSSQIINTQMLQPNSFNSGLTTAQLSSFFAVPAGTLTTGGRIGARDMWYTIAFLVSWYDNYNITNLNQNIYARLFDYFGNDLLPANERINLRTATIEVRSPYYNGGNWLNTQIPYVWVISALGYTQVFYTKYNATTDLQFQFGTTQGYQLNTTDIGVHFWENAAMWQNSSPFISGQGNNPAIWYPYLYRLLPIYYHPTDHDQFARSLGYRWCSAPGPPATVGCFADLSGSHTIQELAFKGMTREGVYCSNHAVDYKYQILGNYEQVKNTAGAPTLRYYIYTILAGPNYSMVPNNNWANYLQHYTVRTSDYNNYDGNYVINLFQPVINNAAGNYYTAGVDDVDPIKMILNNGNNTPFFTAFKWDFRLVGGVLAAGAANTDIVDVYIDTDGDGIPDAWDNQPTYFDANGNGVLDGLESAVGFNAAANIILNVAGVPYVFPVPGINQVVNNPVTSLPVNGGPIVSTPFIYDGTQRDSRKNNAAVLTLTPEIYYGMYNVSGGRLYIQCDGDADASFDDLCRQYPTWSPILATRLAQKSRYIYGTVNGAQTAITLDRSDELIYLDNNNFSAANRVTRTPAGW